MEVNKTQDEINLISNRIRNGVTIKELRGKITRYTVEPEQGYLPIDWDVIYADEHIREYLIAVRDHKQMDFLESALNLLEAVDPNSLHGMAFLSEFTHNMDAWAVKWRTNKEEN